MLINILQKIKPVDETLRLTGKAMIEDMNFSRVCIGASNVSEIAALMKTHGEKLLQRNIRSYLGLHGNRVNEGIRATLQSENPSDFYFFNNGLTLVCSDFSYNALQGSDYQIKVENLQIVNGGQTCMTIFKTLEEMSAQGISMPDSAFVLVRIYKLPKDSEDMVLQITHATNSQNPVDLKDLKSNDEKQERLQNSIEELGFSYRRKRMDTPLKTSDITSGVAAEAILSVWRTAPHQAKFLIREHFGKLYDTIFSDSLNGAQTVIAVLLYRIAENRRKRPAANDPIFVRYASCFIAMQMGKHLLRAMNISLANLDHRNFSQAKQLVEAQSDVYFMQASTDIQIALTGLYGIQEISLQQLSATFRRGDLIDRLTDYGMIYELSGDILLSHAKVIVQGVAPNDDFHHGLALQLRERMPAMYKDFRHHCQTQTSQVRQLVDMDQPRWSADRQPVYTGSGLQSRQQAGTCHPQQCESRPACLAQHATEGNTGQHCTAPSGLRHQWAGLERRETADRTSSR